MALRNSRHVLLETQRRSRCHGETLRGRSFLSRLCCSKILLRRCIIHIPMSAAKTSRRTPNGRGNLARRVLNWRFFLLHLSPLSYVFPPLLDLIIWNPSILFFFSFSPHFVYYHGLASAFCHSSSPSMTTDLRPSGVNANRFFDRRHGRTSFR